MKKHIILLIIISGIIIVAGQLPADRSIISARVVESKTGNKLLSIYSPGFPGDPPSPLLLLYKDGCVVWMQEYLDDEISVFFTEEIKLTSEDQARWRKDLRHYNKEIKAYPQCMKSGLRAEFRRNHPLCHPEFGPCADAPRTYWEAYLSSETLREIEAKIAQAKNVESEYNRPMCNTLPGTYVEVTLHKESGDIVWFGPKEVHYDEHYGLYEPRSARSKKWITSSPFWREIMDPLYDGILNSTARPRKDSPKLALDITIIE